jgi:hypothetical protein
MGVEVVWLHCEDAPPAGSRAAYFTIRLRSDAPRDCPGESSLGLLGRAFVSPSGAGYLADVYYGAIQFVAAHWVTDADALLGYAIAHELGHLLLGPGHVASGVMRAEWNKRDLFAIRLGWLKFDCAQCARIQHELQARAALQDNPQPGSR